MSDDQVVTPRGGARFAAIGRRHGGNLLLQVSLLSEPEPLSLTAVMAGLRNDPATALKEFQLLAGFI